MFIRTLFVNIALFITFQINAQHNDLVLFSIDSDPVYASEFLRVFQKNKDIVVDENQQDFDSYFELFIDFKLKLKQAYELELDTLSSYQDELVKYKEQLMVPYLQNTEATEHLIREAYDRTIEEVKVSHILIKVSVDALPKDTLVAYDKIMEARNLLLKETSFEQVAKRFSEDPSVSLNGGDLGYFSVFSMVYSFENAAYHTNINDISLPFRTEFGYHILKVSDKRKSRGEIKVGHIMINERSEDPGYALNSIQDIYNKLKQKGDFGKIASEHSDDKGSAQKGGVLPQFGRGKMIEPFDSIAFSLKKIGEFSSPFQSEFGWHILKLLNQYPVESFETLHDQLKIKIENSSRSIYIKKNLAQKLERQYIITENLKLLSAFYQGNKLVMESNQILLSIGDESFTAKDLKLYLQGKKNKNINEVYDEFKDEQVINYYKNRLEFTNKEFAGIYKEYKDGLLLFELLKQEIWDKSEKDTLGLKDFYHDNILKYSWKERGELTIASCTNMEKAQLVKRYLEENKSIDEIKTLLNEGATIHVLFSSGTLERGSHKLPINYVLKQGVSNIFSEKDHEYTLVRVDKILPKKIKKFDETRGEVVNDYQIYLEKQWVDQLRERYEISVNKGALKKIKSEYADY